MRVSILLLALFGLVFAGSCSPNPCSSGNACCVDARNGAMCYSPAAYSCSTDLSDGKVYLCASGTSSCNGGCFQPAQYSCTNGALVQKTSMSTTAAKTSSTTGPKTSTSSTASTASTSSKASTSSTTKQSTTSTKSTTTTSSTAKPSTTSATTSSTSKTSSTTKPTSSSSTYKPTSSSSSSKSTSSQAAVTSTPSPIVNPQPVPVQYPTCNAVTYDTTLYSCSNDGGSQYLCPVVKPSTPSTFWVEDITHNGLAAFNENPSGYVVFRNVKSFGAKGDGVTDDTAAINAAITAYGRCGQGCDSSTIRPALVYFPAGVYRISSPIIQYYMTQLVGDALHLPTISALPNFSGMAMIDSDPYGSSGTNWYTNQNNFYRQVRNFVLDTRATPSASGTTAIHWQVAQATSLFNLVFQLSQASGTNHQGVWMENGSGGFMSDLVFYGGKFAMWVGNQQFTSRNITIYNADTAVFMNWNWGWSWKSLFIYNCNTAFDLSSGGSQGTQQVGSVTIVDAIIADTPTGFVTTTSAASSPKASGSLVLDNVIFRNVATAVRGPSGATLLAGSAGTLTVPSWVQGYVVQADGSSTFQQGYATAPAKSSSLLDAASSQGFFYERQRPQYENYQVSDFINVKQYGAKGDGSTDDTAAISAILLKYAGCKIIFFPAGTYIVSTTVYVPGGSRIVGEVWSQIMAKGATFSDANNPAAVFLVGKPGEVGVVELTDLLFGSAGAQPGAILIQWNIRDPAGQQGRSGAWDVHARIGGAAGTGQQVAQCPKGSSPTPQCLGVFMLLHVAPGASAYLENMWMWTADHDLDGNGQVSIFNSRGILIESQSAAWMYGVASEHNVFYQFQYNNAKNVLSLYPQTETPYYQGSPQAPAPFSSHPAYNDPDFSSCTEKSGGCGMAWGLRATGSTSSVFIYGAGHYNFFDDYDQTCLDTEDCQQSMVDLSLEPGSNFYIYNLNTKAAVNMVVKNGKAMAAQSDFRSTFCSTVHYLAAV